MKQNSLSLTEGNIAKVLIRFSVPFLLANLLQALYGAVDLFVIGRFCDGCSIHRYIRHADHHKPDLRSYPLRNHSCRQISGHGAKGQSGKIHSNNNLFFWDLFRHSHCSADYEYFKYPKPFKDTRGRFFRSS